MSAFTPFVSFLTSWLFTLVCIFLFHNVARGLFAFPVLASSLQAFVENNPSIRWCPAARCERAVRLTRPGPSDSDLLSFPLLPSPAVDCGKGHLFCWYTR